MDYEKLIKEFYEYLLESQKKIYSGETLLTEFLYYIIKVRKLKLSK